MEERENVIVLVDEDGEEVEFEYIDNIELNGSEYVVLMPMVVDEDQSEEEINEEEVVILKVDQDDEGVESFVSIEDEDELNEVFEVFKVKLQEELELLDE